MLCLSVPLKKSTYWYMYVYNIDDLRIGIYIFTYEDVLVMLITSMEFKTCTWWNYAHKDISDAKDELVEFSIPWH